MAEKRTMYTIRENEEQGDVRISEDVIRIIAGLAATEVPGVASLSGGVTKDIIAKLSGKKLSTGVMIVVEDGSVAVSVVVQLMYGYSVVDVSTQIQEKIKTAIESMTGLAVSEVNVRVAGVNTKEN